MIKQLRELIVPVSAAALLVACSSDGGGGGSSGPVNPPEPPEASAALPITAENAPLITADVLDAVTSTTDLVGRADVIGLPVVGGVAPGLTKVLQKTVIVDELYCDSGLITVTWHDEDDDFELSTGDSLQLEFDACWSAGLLTLDGTSTVSGIVVAGDVSNQLAPWALEATVDFDQLRATDSEGTTTVDGALGLRVGSEDNLVVEMRIDTDAFSANSATFAESLRDFSITERFDVNSLVLRINTAGVLSSTALEGSVRFETLEDFVAVADDYPHAGRMLISDAVSSVRVTVLDNLNVQLEVDEDLDGSIDAILTVAWSDLVPED